MRPLGSLGLAFAAPACEPGQDTFATPIPRLNQFALGRPPLLAMRWPSATGLTSCLSGCFLSQAGGAVFNIAGLVEVFLHALPGLRFLPAARAHFVPPFGVFLWAGLVIKTARVTRIVLMHSSNRLPSG